MSKKAKSPKKSLSAPPVATGRDERSLERSQSSHRTDAPHKRAEAPDGISGSWS